MGRKGKIFRTPNNVICAHYYYISQNKKDKTEYDYIFYKIRQLFPHAKVEVPWQLTSPYQMVLKQK